mgnify:CR=1 FL=1
MASPHLNRSGELEVFVRVIELGGFSAAARACGMTPSAVSKLVTRLEQRLGTRLVNRSTRQLQLTAEGCAFYERGVRILADLDEAERCASAHAAPRGRVRVNANVPFGHHLLLPLVPDFLAEHPEVTLDIVLTDEVVDLLEQRTDVAVRAGPLRSSSLVARRLGTTRMVIVGAPAYLETHGVPATPDDLPLHNRLGANYVRAQPGWPLRHQPGRVASSSSAGGVPRMEACPPGRHMGGVTAGDQGARATGTHRTAATHRAAPASREEPRVIPVNGNAQASDGEALRHMALAGLGLARLAAFQVREDIAAGRLVPVLEAFNPGDEEAIHAVYLGQGGHLPLRVWALLDFLAKRIPDILGAVH